MSTDNGHCKTERALFGTRPSLSKVLFGLILVGALAGCSGPLWQFPGGALQGPEAPLDLSDLAPEGGVIQLETNPSDPYSVNIGYVTVNGSMYIDPAESRTWYKNIKANNAVRIRFDGAEAIHPANAVVETDPEVLKRFEADRIVLQLAPK